MPLTDFNLFKTSRHIVALNAGDRSGCSALYIDQTVEAASRKHRTVLWHVFHQVAVEIDLVKIVPGLFEGESQYFISLLLLNAAFR